MFLTNQNEKIHRLCALLSLFIIPAISALKKEDCEGELMNCIHRQKTKNFFFLKKFLIMLQSS